MLNAEKLKLIELFANESRWCRRAEARDSAGSAVHYRDATAKAWDLAGGMRRLFGWDRTQTLFRHVGRDVAKITPARCLLYHHEAASMSALLDFYDDLGTTYELIVARLSQMPVYDDGHESRPGIGINPRA
jgi:hypothetical protein